MKTSLKAKIFILTLILCFSASGCGAAKKTEDTTPFTTEVAADELNMSESANFKTKYSQKPEARAVNIGLAAKSIDGIVIKPGEVFSYNKALGSTTAERGYKKAKIFVNGKEEEGMGGGICQVSSTLYNAVLQADLEIIERHPHSKAVKYVEPNKDAAVSPGGIDFKFKNNKDYSVAISAEAENEEINVTIKRCD